MLRVEDGRFHALGRGLGGGDRFLGFLGVAIELHRVLRIGRIGSAVCWSGCCPRIGLVERREEGPCGLGRGVIELGWQHDPDPGVEIAASLAAKTRHSLALQPEAVAVLGPGWNAQEDSPLQGRDRNLGAEKGLRKGDRQLALKIVALAREHRVGPNPDRDDEVAAARTLTGQLDLRSGVGTTRDRDVESTAVELDAPDRAVERFFEADLRGRLGGGPAGRRPADM